MFMALSGRSGPCRGQFRERAIALLRAVCLSRRDVHVRQTHCHGDFVDESIPLLPIAALVILVI
jgi:hypothetical protein